MKLKTTRCYPKTLRAINKEARKLGSQQEVLEKWYQLKVTCECNKND